MQNCLFCKIINGEVPAYKVFENDKVFAFLDINPLIAGHILVIPKAHYENIFDTPEDYLKEIIIATKQISKSLKEKLDADAVQLANASGKEAEQSVFHFHLHVIPRYNGDNLNMGKWWHSKTKELSEEELKKIVEKLKQ